jgi:hypothetical protein
MDSRLQVFFHEWLLLTTKKKVTLLCNQMTTGKYPKKVKGEAVPVLCWAPCCGDVSHA